MTHRAARGLIVFRAASRAALALLRGTPETLLAPARTRREREHSLLSRRRPSLVRANERNYDAGFSPRCISASRNIEYAKYVMSH